MRINKFFTDNGICSRREADKLIVAGRIRINGKIAKLGDQVEEWDKVSFDGKPVVTAKKQTVYIMYNKPYGVVCTSDKNIKNNIIDAINLPMRVFPIGRLDKDSTGLIFLTNDGDIVNKILRAQYGHEKEYIVEVRDDYQEIFLEKLARGVDIGDYTTKPAKVRRISENTFSIILTEGKNRQIRRMCDALYNPVKRLHRVRIMNVRIQQLKPGQYKDIPYKEMAALRNTLAENTAPQESYDTEE